MSVCEVCPELRRHAETEYDIERTYSDLDAAMSDHHDCAVIATLARFIYRTRSRQQA